MAKSKRTTRRHQIRQRYLRRLKRKKAQKKAEAEQKKLTEVQQPAG